MASMLGVVGKLPDKMKALNEQMKNETVRGASECGRVEVVMSGTGEVRSVKIDSELSGTELETAVMAASNHAGRAAKERFAEAAGEMAKELDLPIPGIEDMIKNMSGSA